MMRSRKRHHLTDYIVLLAPVEDSDAERWLDKGQTAVLRDRQARVPVACHEVVAVLTGRARALRGT